MKEFLSQNCVESKKIIDHNTDGIRNRTHNLSNAHHAHSTTTTIVR